MSYVVKATALAALLLSITSIVVARDEASAFEVAYVRPHNPGDSRSPLIICHGIDTLMSGLPPEDQPPLGRCFARNTNLRSMVAIAFPSPPAKELPIPKRVQGGPAWVSSDKFDIEAKAADASVTNAQLMSMFRQLLLERFELRIHTESKQVKGFELMVAKSGPKFKAGAGNFEGVHANSFIISATNASMPGFADSLSKPVKAPVVDRTGLKGGYEFTLPIPSDVSSEAPSIFTVLRKELGLRLQRAKVTVEIVVIDHAEKPTKD